MRFRLPPAAAAIGMLAATILFTPPGFALEQAKIAARASAFQPVEFDVYLPLQHQAELDQLLNDLHDPSSPKYQQWVTPAEFQTRFAPSSAVIAAVSQELSREGLQVTEVHTQHLHVMGVVGAVETAFSTQIANATYASGTSTLTATRPITLSPALASAGAVLADFTGAIHMRSHATKTTAVADNRYSPVGPYWFDDLKQAYEYPSYKAYTGKGVSIGILMSGNYNPPDMDKYFGHEKLPTPNIFVVNIDGGAPFDPNFSAETHVDIQQAGGMAPGANIVLYNLPSLSDANIAAGLTTIVESNLVDVVNMSFGGPELGFAPSYNGGVDQTGILDVFDALFKQGNAQGITFAASSGDQGALSIPPLACFATGATSKCGSYQASASFPAISPHVTAVGGTNLVTTYNALSPNLNSAYVSEEAFGDYLSSDIFYGTPATGAYFGSGGGVSIHFKKPSFQNTADTGYSMRTIPDLSLQMGGCPLGAVLPCQPDRSATIVAIANGFFGVVGTSISSPDFAGLTALKIERLGHRLGNENYGIYALAAAQEKGTGPRVFRMDINGFNGTYHTKHGYNLVLGNGTLYGTKFILAPNVPEAGIPQTPTNP